MRRAIRLGLSGAVGTAVFFACCVPAYSYQLLGKWTTTATDGGGLAQGDPVTLTWGVVDDGVTIPSAVDGEATSGSNLIAALNSWYGSDEVWMPLFEDSLGRWTEISGVTMVYQEANSGSQIGTGGPAGSASNPDIRIAGHTVDGSSGVLAYNYQPNTSDMVIDTADVAIFTNASNNYRNLRQTITHEVGHGLGIAHVVSSDASFLMEPSLNTSFEGPQLDDILAVQRNYGDAWEKNGGNDSMESATDLGDAFLTRLSIGTDAADATVGGDDVDFISIDGIGDSDFFSFTAPSLSSIDITLTPMGPTYNEGPEGGEQALYDTSALNDLSLELYDAGGMTPLFTVDAAGLGGVEVLENVFLETGGEYYVRVSGSQDMVQLYQLDIEGGYPPGDVNLDGFVSRGSGDPATDDVAAFTAGWGSEHPLDDLAAAWMQGDLNLDGVTDLLDWEEFREALMSGATFLPGDVNIDGVLSIGSGDPATDDMAALLSGWGLEHSLDNVGAAWMLGDLTLDGVTDMRDWAEFREAFLAAGFSASQLTLGVPEPSGGALVAFLSLLLADRRLRL